MPSRTWVIAPDVESLQRRWTKLTRAQPDQVDILFHPHLADGHLGDRHANRVIKPEFRS
jgi:hypothetical protein